MTTKIDDCLRQLSCLCKKHGCDISLSCGKIVMMFDDGGMAEFDSINSSGVTGCKEYDAISGWWNKTGLHMIGTKTPVREYYDSYLAYCAEMGYAHVSRTVFGNSIMKRYDIASKVRKDKDNKSYRIYEFEFKDEG